MKKIAFTLVFALACLVSAAQQPFKTSQENPEPELSIEQITKSAQNRLNYTQRFDSLVDIYDNGKTVIKYAYDDHARLIERIKETQKTYTDTVISNSQKDTFVYDENDNCILAVEYGWRDEDWNEREKHEFTFDANGNCLSRIDSWFGEPALKFLWTYDDDSHCLSEEHWEYNSNHWKTILRYEYAYDVQGNMTLRLRQESDTYDSWKNIYKEEFYYETNGNKTSYIYYTWSTENHDWEEQARTVYTYDANNNLMVSETTETDYAEKTEYTYDEADNLILSTTMRNIDGSWEYKSKTEYEYDQNDSIILEAHYRGPSPDYGPDWRKYSKAEYVRNEAGYITSETHARGSSDSANTWIYEYRYLYEYDDYSQMISFTHLGWSNAANDFVNIEKDAYELDENGNAKGFYHYSFEDNEWIVQERFENTFDLTEDASFILGLILIYNDLYINLPHLESPVHNKWLSSQCYDDPYDGEQYITLYYSDYCNVNENESTSLKAYSSNGTLTVENDAVADIQVFDMLGRLVAQQNQVARCQFHLKPGIYVVKAGGASVKAVVK